MQGGGGRERKGGREEAGRGGREGETGRGGRREGEGGGGREGREGGGRREERGGGRRRSNADKFFPNFLIQVHVTKSGSALCAGISQEAADHQDVSLWPVCPGQVQDKAERLLAVLCQYCLHTTLPTVPHALEAGVATRVA